MVKLSKVVGVSMLVMGWLFMASSLGVGGVVLEFSLFEVGGASLDVSFLVDSVSVMFAGVVLMISGSVFIYSGWYMDGELFFRRFIVLVFLFVVSMLLLVMIPNLLVLIVGWDGLGVSSFLLVVYYQNNKSLSAGMLTALTNRVGDVLILVSVGLLFSGGVWMVYGCEVEELGWLVSALLLVGAVTKSAQVPFSAWLPAAMAAPTPVSALVHSSTLVTAGVYLLSRCFGGLIGEVGVCAVVLKFMSLTTLIMAGMAAVVETDLKKVIALSTLSQLSMMLFSLSVGLVGVCYFHMVVHAAFKALLFLCAGVIIHANGGSQDLRLLGMGWFEWPVSMSCFSVASMSLCGVPFLSGFFSKDLVVELGFVGGESWVVYVLVCLGVVCTVVYSLRLLLNVVWGVNKGFLSGVVSCETFDLVSSYFGLLVSSVVSGAIVGGLVGPFGSPFFLWGVDKSVALVMVLLGVFILVGCEKWFWGGCFPMSWVWFVSGMWNLKFISAQPLAGVVLSASDAVVVSLEKGWLELVGPQGVGVLLAKVMELNQVVQGYFFLRVMLVLAVLGVGIMIVF